MKMDSVSVHKKQKQDEVNRISKLPDELILQILAYLPMKDTVRTSVLSSRWEYVWMSIPNLDFHAGEKISNFVNFVDRSMSLCDSTIKQFSLCDSATIEPCSGCYWEIDAFYFRRWITAAIRRNVEDLCINIGQYLESFDFPKCLFASQSITKLSLRMDCTLNFPPFICLPNLKHLSLEIICFPNEESTKTFLSGCPALETLRLAAYDWSEIPRVCICAPKLQKLEMYKGLFIYIGEVWEKGSCNVVIGGPSLKCFHYEGVFCNDYSFDNAPSLDESSIETEYPFDEDDDNAGVVFPRLYKLLKGISMVKKLSLSAQVIETLGNRINLLPDLPLFINLSILSFNSSQIEIDSIALMKMLQNSPCLEILRFEEGISLSLGCNKDEVLEPVPPCFLSCLKRIEIYFDSFYEDQKLFVDAVKILLARAAVLEKLTIYEEGRVPVWVLNKKLMELPRVSQVCELEFAGSIMKPLWLKTPFS